MVRAVLTGWSTISDFDLACISLLSFSLPFSELRVVGLPLTWLTNHRPSVL